MCHHKGIILITKLLEMWILKGQQRLAHVQLVVKSLDLDDQSVFASHQFVLQLGHFSLVGRLRQVVAQDVDQQVKQDYAGGTRGARQGEPRREGEVGRATLAEQRLNPFSAVAELTSWLTAGSQER